MFTNDDSPGQKYLLVLVFDSESNSLQLLFKSRSADHSSEYNMDIPIFLVFLVMFQQQHPAHVLVNGAAGPLSAISVTNRHVIFYGTFYVYGLYSSYIHRKLHMNLLQEKTDCYMTEKKKLCINLRISLSHFSCMFSLWLLHIHIIIIVNIAVVVNIILH